MKFLSLKMCPFDSVKQPTEVLQDFSKATCVTAPLGEDNESYNAKCVVSDILSGSVSPHPSREKENEHEDKGKGNGPGASCRCRLVSCREQLCRGQLSSWYI